MQIYYVYPFSFLQEQTTHVHKCLIALQMLPWNLKLSFFPLIFCLIPFSITKFPFLDNSFLIILFALIILLPSIIIPSWNKGNMIRIQETTERFCVNIFEWVERGDNACLVLDIFQQTHNNFVLSVENSLHWHLVIAVAKNLKVNNINTKELPKNKL